MVGVELRRRNTQSSGIIAGTSPSVHQPAKSRTAATERSQKRGNVMLTSVSYRYSFTALKTSQFHKLHKFFLSDSDRYLRHQSIVKLHPLPRLHLLPPLTHHLSPAAPVPHLSPPSHLHLPPPPTHSPSPVMTVPHLSLRAPLSPLLQQYLPLRLPLSNS